LRSAAIALTLGRSLDLSDDDQRAGLYSALLLHAGCIGYAHETARAFGDEFAIQVAVEQADQAAPRQVLRNVASQVLPGRRPSEKARVAFTAAVRGPRFGRDFDTASCEVGRVAARRLGLPEAVQAGVYGVSERWDGRGAPEGLAVEAIPMGARLAAVASLAARFLALGDIDAVATVLRARAGGALDPRLALHLADEAEQLIGEVVAADPRTLLFEGEPAPAASFPDPDLRSVATVFGDLADLKSPWFHGHARAVARLAREAAVRAGMDDQEVQDLELAGFLHDVGRVAVSARVWDQPGPLTDDEWEQVRLHAYHAERILAGSERLAPLARLVGTHHERGDGSGYHRGCTGAELDPASRILAAADAYAAMTQDRPHRMALPPERAETELLRDASGGRLHPDAVDAVLVAAGHEPPRRRPELPAGLTEREVEVLRLVAAGCGNAAIGERLVISRRTAETHVQRIYRKIGSSSRASAAMFAMEHGLVEPHATRPEVR
jgi:HD-GYP domain-containing protein (c-di-GMP phosphodiesterase class II)